MVLYSLNTVSLNISLTDSIQNWNYLNQNLAAGTYILQVQTAWLPTDVPDYTVRVYGALNTTIVPLT